MCRSNRATFESNLFKRPPGFRCAHVAPAGARCFCSCCVILATLVLLYWFRVVFGREDWAFSCSSSCKWIHTPFRQTQTFQNHQLQKTNGGVYGCFTVIRRHSSLHLTFGSNLKHGSTSALKRVMAPCANWYTLANFIEQKSLNVQINNTLHNTFGLLFQTWWGHTVATLLRGARKTS